MYIMSADDNSDIFNSEWDKCFEQALEVDSNTETSSVDATPDSQKLEVIVDSETVTYAAPQPLLPFPAYNEAAGDKRFLFKSDPLIEQKRHVCNEDKILIKLSKELKLRCCRKRRLWRASRGSSVALQRYHKDVIEFAFEKLANHHKISDEILFAAIDMFGNYCCMKQLIIKSSHKQRIAAKELLLAAVVLCSKADNVRHLSIKSAVEVAGFPTSSVPSVLEKEKSLFLLFNNSMNTPSACSFIKAILAQSEHQEPNKSFLDEDVRHKAYHLAVYILALNVAHHDTHAFSAEILGNACVWIVALLLRFPICKSLRSLAKLTDNENYCLALQGCQFAENPINVYFSSSDRHCVREPLTAASRTLMGQCFLQSF